MEQYRKERADWTEELRERNEAARIKIKQESERLFVSASSKITDLNRRLNEMKTPDKKLQNRIIKAFPAMASLRHPESLDHFRKALEEQRQRRKKNKSR